MSKYELISASQAETLGFLPRKKLVSLHVHLFTDKGYQTLIHTVVCTNTTSEYGPELAGYGPVVDDGYGVRYFTRADSLCFYVTSRSNLKNNLDLKVQYIESALFEMGELMRAE